MLRPQPNLRPHAQRRQRFVGFGVCALLAALAVSQPACQSTKAQEKPIVDLGPSYTGDRIFYGTVGSLAHFTNDEPMLVSGYGLVAGLGGTGSGEVLPYLAAYMRDQVRRGGLNPTIVLGDRNTAVVSVQGLIPPGAGKGEPFDLWIESTVSSVTSLSGGRLYTTDMQPGPPARDPGKYLGRVAAGSGTVYMDPFDKDGWEKGAAHGVTWEQFQRQAIILGGGKVVEARPLYLTLNQPSYSVASQIVNAITTRFPQSRADRAPAAFASDSQHISLNIPAAFAREPAAFIEQVRWLYVQRLDPAFPPAQTSAMLAALAEEPKDEVRARFADHCVQAWKAMGRGSLSALRPAYTLAPGSTLEHELWPNETSHPGDPKAAARLAAARAGYPAVRDAAVRAGAALGDVQAVDVLVAAVAQTASPAARKRLALILADQPNNQGVLAALRQLMADKDTEVRVAAYESYSQCYTRLADAMGGGDLGAQQAENAMGFFHRTFSYDADERPKYAVDVVPVGDPLVVMSVSGRPRVVIFGADAGLKKPLNVWFEGADAPPSAGDSKAAREAAARQLATDAKISLEEATAQLERVARDSAPIPMGGHGRLNLRVRDEMLTEEMRESMARQVKAERGIPFADAYRAIPQTRETLAFTYYPGDNTKTDFKAVNSLATLAFTLGQHHGSRYALPGLSLQFDQVTRVMNELSKRGALSAPVEIRMSPLADRMRKAAQTARKPDAIRPENGVEDLSSVLGENAKPKAPAPASKDQPKDDAATGSNPYKQ